MLSVLQWASGPLSASRHIAVLVRRALAPLDVLLVDQHLDALLYHADAGAEPGFGLVDHLQQGKKKPNHHYSKPANGSCASLVKRIIR